MLVFLLYFVSGSEDGRIPTFWLLLYKGVLVPLKGFEVPFGLI